MCFSRDKDKDDDKNTSKPMRFHDLTDQTQYSCNKPALEITHCNDKMQYTGNRDRLNTGFPFLVLHNQIEIMVSNNVDLLEIYDYYILLTKVIVVQQEKKNTTKHTVVNKNLTN